MDLRAYLGAIRKSWWVIVLLAVVGFAGGYAYAGRQTPIYQASVSFYVSTPSATDANVFSNGQFAQGRATSYAALLSSDRLAKQVVDANPSLRASARQVSDETSASADLNTVIVRAEVKDPSPSRALAIAGALGREFPKMVDNLDNSGSSNSVSLSVVSGPVVGQAPISPRTKVDAIIGLVIGLVIALAIAVLRDVLNTTVRTGEQLTDIFKAPVLSTVPQDNGIKRSPLVIGEAARSMRAEALRQLRTNLQFMDVTRPAKVITITSSVGSEGKSATAANLALVEAELGRRVLIIEADLRRPHVCEYFGLERAVGLSNVLARQLDVSQAIQTWSPHLDVLASGTLPPNPSELLSSATMVDLLRRMREIYDLILIDTPPLLPVTDAAVVGVLTDGVIMVVRHGKTSRSHLIAAADLIQSVDVRLLGEVLNMKPIGGLLKHKYGYDYQPSVVGGENAEPMPVELVSAFDEDPRSGKDRRTNGARSDSPDNGGRRGPNGNSSSQRRTRQRNPGARGR